MDNDSCHYPGDFVLDFFIYLILERNMRQMKNSGIEWVGEIPAEWECKPIRALFLENNNKNYFGKETKALQFKFGKIVPKQNFNADDDDYVAETILKYNIVDKGMIVINGLNLNFDFVTKRVGLVRDRGIITSAYMSFSVKDVQTVMSEYACYLLKSYDNCAAFHNMGGGVRKILNFDELKHNLFVLPPYSEQKAIAEFLDKKCGEVDALIADIQQEIETLEQYKRSAITESVTKGLDPSVPMKDSGAGWMPTVPAHWLVEKIKYHLHLKTQKNMSDRQVLSLYRDYGIVPKDSRDDNHNVTSEDTSSYRYVRVGDFVVNKMKAWQGSVAVSQYEGIVSPAYFVYEFIDESFDKKYFHYLLRNKSYTTEFMRLSGGIRVGQWDLPAEAFENTLVLIPPIEEQQQIADYLDKKCKEIEGVIADKQSQIETLESYKKSLIYEYVTGKKEVIAQ